MSVPPMGIFGPRCGRCDRPLGKVLYRPGGRGWYRCKFPGSLECQGEAVRASCREFFYAVEEFLEELYRLFRERGKR